MMKFEGFPKIPRLFREVVVTEKIDGTNGQIYIRKIPDDTEAQPDCVTRYVAEAKYQLYAGSRSRWLTLEKDNHGFCVWAYTNAEALIAKLGEGHHFGEWWGKGIQRNYGLKEKRFSLFNVSKWGDDNVRPVCCSVVPVLRRGPFDTDMVRYTLGQLAMEGSKAAPGFMKPEGVVVYHTQGNVLFKVTIENDEKGKGERCSIEISKIFKEYRGC